MKSSIANITKLRQATKTGVMDCRKALEESGGDLGKAKKWLVKKGLSKAAKRGGRATGAGLIEAYIHAGGTVGAMVKLVCETDFVARNKEFKKLAHEIAMQAAATNPKDVKSLLREEYIRDSSKKVGDLVKEAIAKLGENIKIKKVTRFKTTG